MEIDWELFVCRVVLYEGGDAVECQLFEATKG